MPSVLALVFFLLAGSTSEDPWTEVRLTIARDPYTSSDEATLCRVRAVNTGGRSWSGKALRFEARAHAGTRVVRQRGRFGLELAPYGSLETIVALPGRHDQLEVIPIPFADGSADDDRDRSSRRRTTRRRSHP